MRPFTTLLVTLVFGAVACGDATGPGAAAGTYFLQTVDGSALPRLVLKSQGFSYSEILQSTVLKDVTVDLISGSMRLNSDARFDATHTFRNTEMLIALTGDTVGTNVTRDSSTTSGTFTVADTSIQFTHSDGQANAGTLSENTLTLTWNGSVGVYER